ncbi:hypothetical protein RB195_023881 [Necator americanus]|uniref:Reverse transcriptase domain-containing protein n=1 Tax=Necator americanus TaxID=51031 RepID=A0ABR1EL56_NECAM
MLNELNEAKKKIGLRIAETMLNELNETKKKIGLRINRRKTQFMKNVYCEDGGVQLEGFKILETSSYVYLGRSTDLRTTIFVPIFST